LSSNICPFKKIPMKYSLLKIPIILILFLNVALSQSYNDGPVEIIVKVRDINVTFNATDLAVFGVVGQPDDLTFYLSGRDAVDIDGVDYGPGSGCLADGFNPPGFSADFNSEIFNHTYSGNTVPAFVEVSIDAWEDESPDQIFGIGCQGTRCAYETDLCCGGILFGTCLGIITDDEYRCNSDLFTTLDYRLGPVGTWYNHGYVAGSCPDNNFYLPRLESYWRYTNGSSCDAPIDLGQVDIGFTPISHTNNSQPYMNNQPFAPGKDVTYIIDVVDQIGLDISLCGSGNFASEIYILDMNCMEIASAGVQACGDAELYFPACPPGQYYIVVEGATASDEGEFTLAVSEGISPLSDITGRDTTICQGEQVDLSQLVEGTPMNMLEYGETFGNYGISPVVSPMTTMTYFVRDSSDLTNCSDTAQITVVVINNMSCLMNFASENINRLGLPCDCQDFNIANNTVFARDKILVDAPPSQSIVYSEMGSTGVYNAMGEPMMDMMPFIEASQGMYELTYYKPIGVTPIAFVLLNGEGPFEVDPGILLACSGELCPNLIPTLGQWAIIILGLLILIIGSAYAKSIERKEFIKE
jgi:hypothetical protein